MTEGLEDEAVVNAKRLDRVVPVHSQGRLMRVGVTRLVLQGTLLRANVPRIRDLQGTLLRADVPKMKDIGTQERALRNVIRSTA